MSDAPQTSQRTFESKQTSLSSTSPSLVLSTDGVDEGITCENGGCWQEHADHVNVRFTDESEFRAARVARDQPTRDLSPSFNSSTRDSLSDVIARIDGLPEGEIVRVKVALTESQPPDFRELRGLTAQDRSAWIANRKQQLTQMRAGFLSDASARGVSVGTDSWLINAVTIEGAADSVRPLLMRTDVVNAWLDDANGHNNEYSGEEVTDAIRSENYVPPEWAGERGGRVSSPTDNIKIGNIDWNTNINCSHVGWEDWSGGSSRIKAARDCYYIWGTGFVCEGTDYACGTSSTHGTRVGWAALGSIEQNQDSNHTSSSCTSDSDCGAGTTGICYAGKCHNSDQRKRSGVAQEAHLYYYKVASVCETAEAIETAVEDGVDVLNMSIGIDAPEDDCELDKDVCGINLALWNAFDAGMLMTGAAGNRDESNGCSVQYPHYRSSVVAVGFLDTANASTAYNDTVRLYNSGLGGCDGSAGGTRWTEFWDGDDFSLEMMSILAPGRLDYLFGGGTNNYTFNWCGSSYAAPQVAAAAGLIREWMEDYGWDTADEPGAHFAHLLMMGDGYTGYSGDPDSETDNFMDDDGGAGRLKLHYPSSTDMGSGYAWRSRSTTIYTGGTVEWSIGSSSAEQTGAGVKVGLFWRDWDLNYIPDIILQAVDKCPSGGGEEIVLTAHSSNALQKRLHLTGDQVSGRCLYIRLTGAAIPSSGTDFWAASYKYTNSEAVH